MSTKEHGPRVGLGVYIFNDKNEILIGKRIGKHGFATYAPPGGHLEFGESIEECAARETLEETGITIKNITVAGVTNDIYSEDKHYITIAVTALWAGGEVQIMEPNKCEKWEWVKWEDFPENLFLSVANFRKQTKELRP
ncbi:MAG: NUDIX hydrolase [Firmicutes bacterium]|nr:NUDIX hydrolase [Bacillota bacterium]MCL2771314.1 NUDIX hydrolase [Bacillota bacterium]